MAFWAALSFLTVFPVPARVSFSPRILGRSVGYFPLVGGVLGSILVGWAWVLDHVFPPYVVAAGVLVAWIGMTGAIHVDGFLDTCDGLFGGHTPDERLHIMRDSRIGAFAFVGGMALLLLKYTALLMFLLPPQGLFGAGPSPAGWRVLLLAPVWGRFAMSLAVVCFPYARKEGLGRAMKDAAGTRELLLAGGMALALSLGVGGVMGVGGWLGVGMLAWTTAVWVMRRIPGLTGDVYGALCEIGEVGGMLLVGAGMNGYSIGLILIN